MSNQVVFSTHIKEVYDQEFVSYGDQLSTKKLQEKGFVIKEKKVYRLMKENGLLLDKNTLNRFKRTWVKEEEDHKRHTDGTTLHGNQVRVFSWFSPQCISARNH